MAPTPWFLCSRPVQSAILIDVVAQQQQQLRMQHQQLAALQHQPTQVAQAATPPAQAAQNPFQGYPGTPLPQQMQLTPQVQMSDSGNGAFQQPDIQSLSSVQRVC